MAHRVLLYVLNIFIKSSEQNFKFYEYFLNVMNIFLNVFKWY